METEMTNARRDMEERESLLGRVCFVSLSPCSPPPKVQAQIRNFQVEVDRRMEADVCLVSFKLRFVCFMLLFFMLLRKLQALGFLTVSSC